MQTTSAKRRHGIYGIENVKVKMYISVQITSEKGGGGGYIWAFEYCIPILENKKVMVYIPVQTTSATRWQCIYGSVDIVRECISQGCRRFLTISDPR